MSDPEQEGPKFYWFQATTNPYAVRIKEIMNEAIDATMPPFQVAHMLRELAREIDRPVFPPPPSYWDRLHIAFIRFFDALLNRP